MPRGSGIILYDFLSCHGGAESLTLELVRGLPGADLCFGFRRAEAFPDELFQGVRLFELARPTEIAAWRTLQGLYVFRRRTAFLRGYDWVLYSGSNAPVAVYNHPEGANIYYCHSMPRFAYDLYAYYLHALPIWQRTAFKLLASIVRRQYEIAMPRMDCIIANSENVRARIKRYLGRDSEVVYPPCDVDGFQWLGQGNYYLSTARLEPYKRVNLIIEAFVRMPDKRLIVASGGSDGKRLQRLAGRAENIEWVGWQTDRGLRELVGRAIATVYVARDEDFGMSPVESMAAGKPVVGVAEGGLLESVVHRETGFLLPREPSVEDLISGIEYMKPSECAKMRKACEERARIFDRSLFVTKMRRIVFGP